MLRLIEYLPITQPSPLPNSYLDRIYAREEMNDKVKKNEMKYYVRDFMRNLNYVVR